MPRTKDLRPQRGFQKSEPRSKRRQVHEEEWAAEVVKVERYSSKEYNAGPV